MLVHAIVKSKPSWLTAHPEVPVNCTLVFGVLVSTISPTCCSRHPTINHFCSKVLAKLMAVWISPERKQRFALEETTVLEQIAESKLLVKCFLTFCRHHAAQDSLGEKQVASCGPCPIASLSHERLCCFQVDLLFMMLSIFSEHTLINYSFLKDFYLGEVAKEYPPDHKVVCLKYFLIFFQRAQTPQEDKVQALQLLVLPMLISSFTKRESGGQPTVCPYF